ncbi:MAG: hypothetical protein HQM08_27820 [Candidatus Riflebacteria bacterium]|nr:hypothetical protein [Candidatus Riflebacteria bacterium]
MIIPTGRYVFGEWKNSGVPFTVNEAVEICQKADENRLQIRSYPLDKIFKIFSELRKRWNDRDYPPRRSMLEQLPDETGFSPEMIEKGLNQLNFLLDSEQLQKKLDTEMRKIPKVGEYRYNGYTGTGLFWEPIGTVLHVLSGNVFLAGIGSLIEGLITGNVSILKMSSDERIFIPAFLASLQECDKDGIVARSICAIDYSSSQTDVIAEFKKRVDAIVVWGGENAVKAYHSDLPARTRLIVFGPKISLAVITSEPIVSGKTEELARKMADDVSIWDQHACTAPQICFVEGKENAEIFAVALAGELEKLARTLPAGRPAMGNAVEIRKMRDVAEIAMARNSGGLYESKGNLAWTVILDNDKSIEPSPLNRTIRVVPYKALNELTLGIEALRGYVQTIGLAANPTEKIGMINQLSAAGGARITDVGGMAGGEIDDPHDGAYDLSQYVNFIVSRDSAWDEGFDPIDFMTPKERQKIIDQRLRILIEKARNSKFYSKRLEGIEVEGASDLEKIPILTRADMESNLPPAGTGLLTGGYFGGYVSRSGGSTGEPKFSIYDSHDWEEMIGNAVRLFRAIGIRKGDRLANCFLAGDLYGSFVSFDHINVRTGVTNFAFGGNVKPDVFLKVWTNFWINVVQGVPAIIVPLFRQLKSMRPDFSVEKILYAGEPMSEADRDWVRKELGAKTIASVIGANDGGQIAFQCGQLTGREHHVIDDFNYIEIVDESGNRVPDGKVGRILITSLLKFAVPLIRYEIGDLGRIVGTQCRCGRTQRVIEYLGRADDMICAGLMNVKLADIREAVKEFPISGMQLVAGNSEGLDFLVLKVEMEDASADKGNDRSQKTTSQLALSLQIRETVLSGIPTIRDRLKARKLGQFDVELYKPGEIPRNERTGKLKGIVDKRK